MKRRKQKKSESLDIRLPFEQKREFMEATRLRGETASSALRRFIATYIEEARLAEQPHPVQEITMTLARHRFKTIATAAGAALGVFSVTALPSAADSAASMLSNSAKHVAPEPLIRIKRAPGIACNVARVRVISGCLLMAGVSRLFSVLSRSQDRKARSEVRLSGSGG